MQAAANTAKPQVEEEEGEEGKLDDDESDKEVLGEGKASENKDDVDKDDQENEQDKSDFEVCMFYLPVMPVELVCSWNVITPTC